MTKQELLRKVAEASGANAKMVQKILHHYQLAVLKAFEEEGAAVVLDLGQLKISDRSERTGINPQTKQPIKIPAKKVPKFSASRKLKGFVEKSVSVEEFKYYSVGSDE